MKLLMHINMRWFPLTAVHGKYTTGIIHPKEKRLQGSKREGLESVGKAQRMIQNGSATALFRKRS